MSSTLSVAGKPLRPRVLIIADSLALPRDDVAYEHTWPGMLEERLPTVTWINRAQRLSTSERLNGEGNQGADCLELYQPDLVVLQLGICDCAPRVLHRRTAAYVYRLPFGLGERFSSWLSRWRGRKISNCFVPLTDYESNLRDYLIRAAAHGTKVIALATLPPSNPLVSNNPLIGRQIDAYNEALDRLAERFSCLSVLYPFRGLDLIDGLFVEDGYHLNEKGALRIAAALEPLVRGALERHAAA
ncbi:SGNH/GDSL hydrolase family protein [Chromobacterium violaceum]|uniref:SGNH/GDSL hydrolase family protein n=1 Tax=Chromobacterium violaceum TaxID=536 RepID=UPI00111C728D|nr:SGNH/GDSL hydrolase family protein [Chromobacterium violaceum]MBX9268134.1 SGNH/GDSL hydrolase family protein [Chromobacterium violaceum]QRO31295.1 SGNH/GDSL hydrolase family protein [Chromobacterium violaceum]QRQ18904.1 SGNH/GDSL hydrolase family protein [Chromobacterium violaceum]